MTENEARRLIGAPSCEPILHFVKPEYIGVEIGAFLGTSSVRFLDTCKYMYFIDPFGPYPGYHGPINDFIPVDAFLKTLKPYNKKQYTLFQELSSVAAPKIPLVNFVYIDGNHEPDYVRMDLALYWPKVLNGGFLSGHDYGWAGHVVREFFGPMNHKIEVFQDCWVVKKP
jgi:hypothetical protein